VPDAMKRKYAARSIRAQPDGLEMTG
jgi:hypothetical protein